VEINLIMCCLASSDPKLNVFFMAVKSIELHFEYLERWVKLSIRRESIS